jgi:serine phosphatase RsbU (regulator of sigma subunit)
MAFASLSQTASPKSDGRLKVLLIEDNPGDVRLIEVMLSEAGSDSFELEHAERLKVGLERLSRGGIGMVLVDLSLPDSHGLGTFSKVRAHAPHLPIIVMSGLDNETVAVNAVHEGAQDYLVKGHVDGHALVRAMRYAIERKHLADELARHAEELRRKNTQLEEDLHMAREIQQLFVPPPHLYFPVLASAEQAALRFHSLYLAPTALSGDFFNIFTVNEYSAGVFICDVMGHGVRAALITAVLRTLVEELRSVAADAGTFLREINRRLYTILRQTEAPTFATAFYAVADVAAGELNFASAGHPSPVWVRPGVQIVEPLKSQDPRHGPALGLFEKADYPTCRVPLALGDRIILYTDGLYEIEGRNGEEFGLDRLLAAVRQRSGFTTEALFQALLADIRQFAAGREFDDDVCLVGMEVARLAQHSGSGDNI